MSSNPALTLVPACSLDAAALAKLFNEAFADYLIKFPAMPPAAFQRFLSAQGVDLEWSRLVYLDDEPVGFGFIHRTGDVCRLAGMGVVPKARRRGAARTLLDVLLSEAGERGDHLMTLEVFEQNPRALDLYQSRGFKPLVRLHGWHREPLTEHSLVTDSKDPSQLEPASLPDLATSTVHDIAKDIDPARLSSYGESQLGTGRDSFRFPNLPWQISMLAVRGFPPSVRAYRVGETLAVVTEPEPGLLRWCALLPLGEESNPWKGLRSAAARVVEEFPMHQWKVPPIFPESYGDAVFGPLGFIREPLNQWHMHRTLERHQ